MAAKERNGIGMIVSAVRDMEGGGISAAATRAAIVLHSKTASELVKDCLTSHHISDQAAVKM